MKNTTWYHSLGFSENPFSMKPAMYGHYLSGQQNLIQSVNDRVRSCTISVLLGEYGFGKTTALQGILKEFGGKRKVIYYNCDLSDGAIDFDALLINAGSFFSRIFRIKQKEMILLLDEAQSMLKADVEKVKEYYDSGYFKSIVFVFGKQDRPSFSSAKQLANDDVFKVHGISEEEAVQIVRGRIGKLHIMSDEIIAKVFRKDNNPRAFLRNCEDVCKLANESGSSKVTDKTLKDAHLD